MKLQRILLATSFLATGLIAQAVVAQDDSTPATVAQPVYVTNPQPAGTTQAAAPETKDKTERGGVYVEPAVKYELLQGKIDYPAPFSSSDVKSEGPGISARLGFHISDVVFAAAEGNYSQLRMTEDRLNYSAKGGAYSYGPMVGVQTPWAGIRLWGTYLLGGGFDPDASQNIDANFRELNGYRLGVGLRVAAIGASLEYQRATYNSAELQNAGIFSGSTDKVKMTNEGWILGVNFPVTL